MSSHIAARLTLATMIGISGTWLHGATGAPSQRVTYESRDLRGVRAHVVSVQLGPDVEVSATTARGTAWYNAESFGSILSRTRPTAAINGAACFERTLKPVGDSVVDQRVRDSGMTGTALCRVSRDEMRTWEHQQVLVEQSVEGPNSGLGLSCPDGFVSYDERTAHFIFDDNRHRAVYVEVELP
jgi:hypothetical protein